jgi:hypothetical protein
MPARDRLTRTCVQRPYRGSPSLATNGTAVQRPTHAHVHADACAQSHLHCTTTSCRPRVYSRPETDSSRPRHMRRDPVACTCVQTHVHTARRPAAMHDDQPSSEWPSRMTSCHAGPRVARRASCHTGSQRAGTAHRSCCGASAHAPPTKPRPRHRQHIASFLSLIMASPALTPLAHAARACVFGRGRGEVSGGGRRAAVRRRRRGRWRRRRCRRSRQRS